MGYGKTLKMENVVMHPKKCALNSITLANAMTVRRFFCKLKGGAVKKIVVNLTTPPPYKLQLRKYFSTSSMQVTLYTFAKKIGIGNGCFYLIYA